MLVLRRSLEDYDVSDRDLIARIVLIMGHVLLPSSEPDSAPQLSTLQRVDEPFSSEAPAGIEHYAREVFETWSGDAFRQLLQESLDLLEQEPGPIEFTSDVETRLDKLLTMHAFSTSRIDGSPARTAYPESAVGNADDRQRSNRPMIRQQARQEAEGNRFGTRDWIPAPLLHSTPIKGRDRTPARKPDGWTRSELIKQANHDDGEGAKTLSGTTFDRIRKAAGIPSAEKGGVGTQRRFSVVQLRQLIDEAMAGTYRNRFQIAAAWRGLLSS